MDDIMGSDTNSDREKTDPKKSMFPLAFSGSGLLALEILPEGYMISDYYCDVVLQEARTAVQDIS
jgi:hypothetical protein